MDIKQSFDAILSEIESKKAELAVLSDKAKADFLRAEARVKDAERAEAEAKKEIEELAEYKRTQEMVNDLSLTDAELTQRKVDMAEKHNKLVRWENTLVEIESRQKTKEDDLAKREGVLAEEKKTYKEKLKKEFFDQLNKQLS